MMRKQLGSRGLPFHMTRHSTQASHPPPTAQPRSDAVGAGGNGSSSTAGSAGGIVPGSVGTCRDTEWEPTKKI